MAEERKHQDEQMELFRRMLEILGDYSYCMDQAAERMEHEAARTPDSLKLTRLSEETISKHISQPLSG